MIEITLEYLKAAVSDYEVARAQAILLRNNRNSLLSQCELTDPGPGGGENCLILAWNENIKMNEDNGEMYDYHEVLSEGVSEGRYCQHCKDAYELKIGPLVTARQNFGNAKRKLSRIGKKILVQQNQAGAE